MSITYHGARRTPKELAALLLRDAIEVLPAGWTPDNLPDPPGARERALVGKHIRQYQRRIRRLLGLAPDGGHQPDPDPDP
jgi:hypothetical protein